MTNLKVGEKFPEFKSELDGKEITLSDFKGKNLVVYFYPRDNTPGCTREAKDFTAHRKVFDGLETEILGISTDSPDSHRKFTEKHDLNINLLSDKNKIICSACGVVGMSGRSAKRTTFLLDREGRIVHIWDKVSVKGHAEDVIGKIKELDL